MNTPATTTTTAVPGNAMSTLVDLVNVPPDWVGTEVVVMLAGVFHPQQGYQGALGTLLADMGRSGVVLRLTEACSLGPVGDLVIPRERIMGINRPAHSPTAPAVQTVPAAAIGPDGRLIMAPR